MFIVLVFALSACSNSSNSSVSVATPHSVELSVQLRILGEYKGIPQGITSDGHYSLGSADAQSVLYDYSDFLCSTCRGYVANTEPQLIEKYVKAGKIRIEFRDILDFGEGSLRASEAAACAGDQGKFWQMHDLLYERQADVSRSGSDGTALAALMLQFSGQIEGLDQARFATCVNERQMMQQVQANDAKRRDEGVTLRPTFEIGELRIFGPQSFEQMSKAIDQMLASLQ
ncbi:MAG: Rcas_1661 family thioredoxin-like (seleno)lipoprotein [Anaerolineae bacterium]